MATSISGFDIITRPPFVFLPIIGALGLLGAIAYWAFSRTGQTSAPPVTTVVHRSVRPEVGRPFGSPVPPAAVQVPPTAVVDAPPVVPPETPPPPPVAPPAPAPPPPAPQSGSGDAPPDLPEPGD